MFFETSAKTAFNVEVAFMATTQKILENIEKKARGIYSGSLGFLSLNNTAQLNIVIRTIVAKGNHLEIGAGGAILIDSDPEKEYEEMVLKAEALIHSVQGRL